MLTNCYAFHMTAHRPPFFIIVMAVVQWQLSRHWQRKGWLA